jgi:hypothetical protein
MGGRTDQRFRGVSMRSFTWCSPFGSIRTNGWSKRRLAAECALIRSATRVTIVCQILEKVCEPRLCPDATHVLDAKFRAESESEEKTGRFSREPGQNQGKQETGTGYTPTMC